MSLFTRLTNFLSDIYQKSWHAQNRNQDQNPNYKKHKANNQLNQTFHELIGNYILNFL